jgi:hypothetical protein
MAFIGSISGSNGITGVSGSLLPATDYSYSLGTTSKPWANTVSTAFSGSLTKLTDGTTDFIKGSANIAISTGSNGQVTISTVGVGTGDVTGPGSSVANTVPVFSDTSGKVLSDTGVLIDGSNNVTIPGNLTVNGTTTTINSTNLVVKDPIILMGTGSVASNSNGGIVIYSGSSTGNDLVFGRVANDVWGAGTLDTQNGSTTSLTSMVLAGVRASAFQVGGATAIITSSDGSSLTVGGTSTTTVSGSAVNFNASSSGFTFQQDATGIVTVQSGTYGAVANMAKVLAQSQGLLLGAADGKDVYVSGSQAVFNNSNRGIVLQRDGTQYCSVRGGAGALSLVISAIDNTGAVNKNLILSGSDVTLGANSSTVNFAFANTTLGQVVANGSTGVTYGSAAGKDLTLSGSSGFYLVHNTASGVQFVQENGSSTHLTVKQNGSDSQITSAADLQLKATGNDIFMQGSTGNSHLKFTNDGSDNASVTGLSGKNLTIGSGLGSTTLTLSGSNVTLNGGAVNFQKNGTTYAYVGTSTDSLLGLFPNTDVTYNLGSPAQRWSNIYTGDLHLRNDRGDYTLIEEADFLTIRFNKTGKRYKFVVEAVPELDEAV